MTLLNLDFLSMPLLTVSALIFASVLAGVFSARLGFSFLLAFLVTGIMAGEDGPGGLHFNDYRLSFWVGNVALAIILLDGGLRTDYATFRTGLRPALVLASLGVLLTAVFTACAAAWLLNLSWPNALLLGAIVGSTDAAAVFSLLRSTGVQLNERVATTLEIESGMNDPMAVYLTLTLIGVATAAVGKVDLLELQWIELGQSLLTQFALGAGIGIGLGILFAHLLIHLQRYGTVGGGIIGLLLASGGLVAFAGVTWLGGSGFLAIYLMGIIVNRRASEVVKPALSALDGYAWLSQALMFVLLGLLVTPSEMSVTLLPALGVAVVLMFIARPLAVFLCLAPLRFQPNEMIYIAWVGLRGAVPIVLAIFPLIAQVPQAQLIFNVAFVVVLASLVLQGSTLGWFARRMGVLLPDQHDTPSSRAMFGDFELQPSALIGDVCNFYDLPQPKDAHLSLEAWLIKTLRRPVIVGDHVALGQAKFSIRRMRNGKVTTVGLKLTASTNNSPGQTQN